jgi:adenylate kinase
VGASGSFVPRSGYEIAVEVDVCRQRSGVSSSFSSLPTFSLSSPTIATTTATTTALTMKTRSRDNVLFLSRAFASSSGSSSSDGTEDDSSEFDEFCKKHMQLPAQEFALGCSLLHQTALGNFTVVEELLQDHPELVNFRDYDRRTPLHVAASEGHLALCQFLVQQGARLNRSDRWGGAPLDDAHRCRHVEVFQFLKEKGATFGSPSQANSFITAAAEGDLDEVKALLQFGNVNLNSGDYDRRTALHLAAGEGHSSMVEFLCQAGANVNIRDRWGNRPMDDAIRSPKCAPACIHVLEKHGGLPGSQNGGGNGHGGNGDNSSSHLGQEALLDLMQQYGKVRGGVLSMDWCDVKDLMKGIGEEPTDEVVQKLFGVADIDGNGVIDAQEFLTHRDAFLGGRPARIILVVGGPGSGKGRLCERLVKECGVVHLSSGDLLRKEVQKGTVLGKQVDEIMKSGGLVSSAMMVTLMKKQMEDHPGKRILLDGFPRSRENATDLVALCGKPELALHLDCSDTVMLERIMIRGKSGARADDNFDTAIQRIRNYHKFHNVTLEFLREEHVPIVFLDCSATADGVWEQLRAIGRLMRSAVRLPTEPISGVSGGASTASSLLPPLQQQQDEDVKAFF